MFCVFSEMLLCIITIFCCTAVCNSFMLSFVLSPVVTYAIMSLQIAEMLEIVDHNECVEVTTNCEMSSVVETAAEGCDNSEEEQLKLLTEMWSR